MAKQLLTTEQAAAILGVSTSRIRQFIMRGQLPAQKFGRDNAIDPRDLARLKARKPGRPKSRSGKE